MKRNKKITLFLFFLLMLYPFATITGNSEIEQTDKILKIGIVGDPENLNPVMAVSLDAWSLINYLYEPLVRWKLSGGDWTPAPGLAESWDLAPNGTQITFHIVENATWHDGVPVTAHDVNWTIFTLTYLSWWQASSPRFDHRNITVIDDHTIAVNLVVKGYENIWEYLSYSPYFGYRDVYNGTPTQVNLDSFLLGLPYMPIFPKHLWDPLMWNHPVWGLNGTGYDPYGYYAYSNWDGISWVVANVFGDFIEPKIGAGPWKFVSWDPGVKIVFEAYDDYHYGRPKIDKLEFVIYPTVDLATQGVIKGDIDFAETNARNVELGSFGDDIDIITNDFMGFDAFFINQNFNYLNKSPGFESSIRPKHLALLEQPVRKAMHQAIDRDRINEIAYLGTATVTDSVMHKSLSWYNDDITHFNMGATEAIATLTADGWFKNTRNVWEKNVTGTSTNETLEFDLSISQGAPTDYLTASVIQESLADAGIKVTIRQVEPTTFVSDFTACTRLATTGCWNYDLMITDYSQTGDPTYMNFYLISSSFINLNGINITRVDEIYELQQFIPDNTARKVLIDEFQQIIYDDSSIIPLLNVKDFEIYRKDRWKFEDTVAQSGMYSLYNTFSLRNVDEAPPPSTTTTPSGVVTIISGTITVLSNNTITTEIPAEASGFTILTLLFSLSLVIVVIVRKPRRR
ncbi:MAG: ABC transporter substrate-binding protein [Candidatus Hodarchaeales archaeon]|jgi:peptide/nickel transport system substrate-binding protein